MKTIVARDNVRGLYRGITSPMAGVGLVNAIVFGIYGNVQRHTENPNSLYSHFLAGSVAGLFQSVVCAPMELAKTRIQLQSDTNKEPRHKGPLDCIRYIARTEGIRGIFKGLGITALRDIPGFASYFVSYEYMMRSSPTPNAMFSLLAGGMAGIVSWLACYPIDVVKTRVQADGTSFYPKYSGAIDCICKGYKSDGYNFFFRGLTSTLIRAFPMNAACFFVVSLIMRMTKDTSLDVVVQSSEPLAVVSIGATSLFHLHEHEHKDEVMNRKRCSMVRGMKAFGAFDEAVCHREVEELAGELYPDSNKYYIFENERLKSTGNHDNIN